jgi:hypothetical protein
MSDEPIDSMPVTDEELERASLVEPPEDDEEFELTRGSHWKI